jgi:small subunit ribosomal protein S1
MLQETITKDVAQNGTASKGIAENTDVSFAELLDQYEPETLTQGQFIQGRLLQINRNVILADVDAKRTAVVPPTDLADLEEEELAELDVGDEVTLYVIRTPRGDEDLLVSLARGLEQKDWATAKEHLESEEPLELAVVGYNKGGLMVDFGHLQGFVPASHVPQLQNIHDHRALISRKGEMVGEKLLLKVIEVDRQRRRLILSAKKAQKEVRQQRLLELKLMEGETIQGRITNLVGFGAFVDLDGIEGLVHVSEIAWQHVDNPADFLALGEEIEVLIQSVETDRERVSLSRKALLPSPWAEFDRKHNEGDLVEGVVTSVVDFGAFALVSDDIEGLIHVSEMYGAHDFSPQDLLSPGDTVLARIIDIQPDRQRLGLSQRRVTEEEELQWIWRRQQTTQAAVIDEEE